MYFFLDSTSDWYKLSLFIPQYIFGCVYQVQHMIEKCLIFHMSKEECVEALSKHANITPVITSTGFSLSLSLQSLYTNIQTSVFIHVCTYLRDNYVLLLNYKLWAYIYQHILPSCRNSILWYRRTYVYIYIYMIFWSTHLGCFVWFKCFMHNLKIIYTALIHRS